MAERVFVAGHGGMVGSAICRQLASDPNVELIVRERAELDLLCQQSVRDFLADEAIDQVYMAAAKVGGIHANNTFPGEFIYENLMVQCNVIDSAYRSGVLKLLFLGSSCIYPKAISQPMPEGALMTGTLEPTNEPYAMAKIAGIKMCESYNRQYGVDYRSVMPTNLYGENDNFHPENSHVIPAMMRRIHTAKLNGDASVTIWGTGSPMREFLYVDDMAAASVYLMNLPPAQYSGVVSERCSHVNIGTGIDCTIRELAETLCKVIGYTGRLVFDESKPDGMPRKLLDVSLLAELGWRATTRLEAGLTSTYQWFLVNDQALRGVSE